MAQAPREAVGLASHREGASCGKPVRLRIFWGTFGSAAGSGSQGEKRQNSRGRVL